VKAGRRDPRVFPALHENSAGIKGQGDVGMFWDPLLAALPGPVARCLLLALAALATAAAWTDPILASAFGAPMLRLAAGQDPSPAAGAAEAGFVGSALWLVFET
jgi:hypothetical protein